jgi:hypothetical protein
MVPEGVPSRSNFNEVVGAHLALRSAQKLANLARSRERASRTSHTTNARAH